MKVKNINGTAGNKCKCGDWKAHWEKYSGEKFGFCLEESCLTLADDGAHVQKDSADDRSWYIVPLCHKHNMQAAELKLVETATLISANVSKTCG
ncbi:hypothetical protein ACET6U_04340 [Aeromonas rivipollensis]